MSNYGKPLATKGARLKASSMGAKQLRPEQALNIVPRNRFERRLQEAAKRMERREDA